jgi:hypothetical protein
VRALVSIHDVTPGTLPDVAEILAELDRLSVRTVTLLVVPGREWSPPQIEQLRCWQAEGRPLAGHGWSHRIGGFGSAWHRVHGWLLSRREAEHLEHDAEGVAAIVRRSHAWFGEAGLKAPELYVAPAWAMGPVDRRRLDELPFRLYEDLRGIYDARTRSRRPLPVTGYLADTPARVVALRLTNAVQRRRRCGPLRIAIHPPDLSLPLRADLRRDLRRAGRCAGYDELD